jgi:hypothetical protein
MRPQTYRGGDRQTPEVEMERAGTTNHPYANAFSGSDASVERTLGADMRLVHGMAVPIHGFVGVLDHSEEGEPVES